MAHTGGRRSRATATAAGAVAAALLAGCNVYMPGWSAVHADGANTDYADVEGAAAVELAWHHDFAGAINLGASIDTEGRVYITDGADGCPLHVLDGETGEELWCSPEVDRFAVVSGPLLDRDGRVFLADGEAMHAFGPDGELLWEVPIEGVPLSAQFTQNGRLVFVTHVGQLHVLRRENGQAVFPTLELIPGASWEPSEGLLACARGTEACPVANTPAFDLSSGRLFTTFWAPGAAHAGVLALHLTEDPAPTITPLWTNDTLPGGSASSPVLSADRTRVYVTDNVDSLHALDAATGDLIWSVRIGYASGGSPSLSPEGLIMPAGGGASPLLAIRDDGDHGTLVWQNDDVLNRGIATQTAGGKAYVTDGSRGGFQNDLVVVDTATGAVLDRDEIPGVSIFTVGTTIGPTGMVYVPTIRGDLYAFRPAA